MSKVKPAVRSLKYPKISAPMAALIEDFRKDPGGVNKYRLYREIARLERDARDLSWMRNPDRMGS